MTKIDIISGFLGAGKTTFIKKMLEEGYKGEKVVLIENEFGEVGIDGGFLKDAGITISEMNSGCICCSLVGDFDKNLREVLATYTPDRIIIEPSGVGKLSDVMASVIKLEDDCDVKLNALVTIVNASKALKQMKAFGEFFNNQIEYASAVVLSRSQNCTDEQLEKVTTMIQSLNDKATVITTPWDNVNGAQILAVMEGQDTLNASMKELAEAAHEAHEHEHHHHHDEDGHCCGHDHDHEDHEHHDHDHDEHEHHHDEDGHCCCGHDHDHEHHHDHDHEHHEHHIDENGHCSCGHDHGHHHADDVFTSWGKETPHKFSKETIEKALYAFAKTEDYGTVIRSKGMVENVDGGWIYFDLVDGEYELRDGSPEITGRIVVIGCDLEEDKLLELFGI